MTGHSRGGAVANMLASLLLEDEFFARENMYVYTFAAPNVTTLSSATDSRYDFIWNIVNAEDVVPTVPMYRGSWTFRKFGHTRALVNRTNTPSTLYTEGYLPRINAVYNPIAERNYTPFTIGPHVPIVVTKLIEHLNRNVERYYSGMRNLHSKAADIMKKIFPEKKQKEDEAFSETDYTLTEIKGYEECAVFDESGNLMARVIDGKIYYEDLHSPVILCPGLGHLVTIGTPATESYTVTVTDETLIQTPTPVTVEYFNAAGVYQSEESVKLYPRNGRVYQFVVGKPLVESQTLKPEKLPSDQAKDIIVRADLRPRLRRTIGFEVNTNSDWNVGFGVHFGIPALYVSALTAQGITNLGRTAELSVGFGNQQSIIGQLKYDTELFAKGIWLERGNDEEPFQLVPELRTSLSMKVIGRLRLFSAGVFDFKIEGFNDDAFTTDKRTTTISTFRITDCVRVAPSIQFGIRF